MRRKDLYDLALNTLRFAKDELAGNCGMSIAKNRSSVSIAIRKNRKDWIEAEAFPDRTIKTRAFSGGKECFAAEDAFFNCLDVNSIVDRAWGKLREKANG